MRVAAPTDTPTAIPIVVESESEEPTAAAEWVGVTDTVTLVLLPDDPVIDGVIDAVFVGVGEEGMGELDRLFVKLCVCDRDDVFETAIPSIRRLVHITSVNTARRRIVSATRLHSSNSRN